MIERIICAMLIAMNIWQNSVAVLLGKGSPQHDPEDYAPYQICHKPEMHLSGYGQCP